MSVYEGPQRGSAAGGIDLLRSAIGRRRRVQAPAGRILGAEDWISDLLSRRGALPLRGCFLARLIHCCHCISIDQTATLCVQFLTLHQHNAKTFKAVIVLPVNSTTPEVLAGAAASPTQCCYNGGRRPAPAATQGWGCNKLQHIRISLHLAVLSLCRAEHTQQRSGLSGVLLLLPPYYGSKPLSADDAAQLLLLEAQLLQKSTAVPVFFARETPELTAAVSELPHTASALPHPLGLLVCKTEGRSVPAGVLTAGSAEAQLPLVPQVLRPCASQRHPVATHAVLSQVADAREAFAKGNPPSQHSDRTQIRTQG